MNAVFDYAGDGDDDVVAANIVVDTDSVVAAVVVDADDVYAVVVVAASVVAAAVVGVAGVDVSLKNMVSTSHHRIFPYGNSVILRLYIADFSRHSTSSRRKSKPTIPGRQCHQ